MKSILFVDEDAISREGVQKLLKRFGFHVETVGCIDDAYQRAENTSFSLILVELSLGKDHGTTLVRQLRAMGIASPIVIYTDHDTEMYQTSALDSGADDYILKTTSISLLIARIHAHLRREDRREGRKSSTQRRISIGRFVVDRDARVLEVDDKVLKLTEKETKIFDLLAQNPSRVFPVPEILEKVWGRDFRKSDDALHAVVKRFRKKLEQECGVKGLIENYHGRGFKLADEPVAPKI